MPPPSTDRPQAAAGRVTVHKLSWVHVVAAAFIQARNVAFGCHEFDQLLHASHHAVAQKTLTVAPLLATARRLMAKNYRAPGMAFPTK